MRKPKYRAVLLDVDDTIFKTREIKWQQHKWVAKNYYGIDLTDETLRNHWGRPFDDMVAAIYENQDTFEGRRANFIRHELEFSKEYQPHALSLIHDLKSAKIVLGLISSMYLEGAMIEYKKLKLPFDSFEIIQGTEATKFHKPDGRVFRPALTRLSELGINNKIAFVGDALTDFIAADDAGLDFIGVTQGLTTAEQFHKSGADKIFANLKDVGTYILNS